MQRMETTPFVTVSMNEAERIRSYRSKRIPRVNSEGERDAHSAVLPPLLLKIGICAAVCLTMLILKWVDTPLTARAVESVDRALSEETDIDEMLGKLQFVELPNVLEVFSASSGYASPVTVRSSTPMDDGRMLLLIAESGADVSSSCKGTVHSIGEDASLGNYVCVRRDEDLDFYYYGLNEIFVEEGQPVKMQDTLGALGTDGRLCLAVLDNGRPMDPRDYIDLMVKR